MLGRALSLYRAHFGAVLLTTALALVPANLLMAGAVRYGLAWIRAGGLDTQTHSREVQDKKQDLQRQDLPRELNASRWDQLGREAIEGSTVFDGEAVRAFCAVAYAAIAIAVLLFAGLLLAHAALVPLVPALLAGHRAGPGEAWAVVAQRFGPLLRTAAVELSLIGLGTLFFVLPGLALATAFAFAVPATLAEEVCGKAALERSVALIRGRWAPVLGMFALLALFTAGASAVASLAPRGLWQLAISALVRVLTYPLPLLGLVLLYPRPRP